MDKFNSTFKINSSRFQNWNYSWKGKYFVTICTQKHVNYFGEIYDSKMHMSEIGLEVEKQWLKSISLRPDMNIKLEDFVIMPNHFHGIIEIGRNVFNEYLNSQSNSQEGNKFGPQRKNLSSIMRGFKGSVTSFARINHILFDWQPRFHDHLIRNEKELIKIKKYIQNNVNNWERDRFNKLITK